VLCYALYPTTGLRFLKWKYGVEAPPPETKARTIEDVRRENEAVAKARKGLPVEGGVPTPAPTTSPRHFTVKVGAEVFHVEVDAEQATPAAAATTGTVTEGAPDSVVTSPMPGLVLRYLVKVGDAVKAGNPVVQIEAMKMQNNLPAPRDGRVARLGFKDGDSVNRGDVLLMLG